MIDAFEALRARIVRISGASLQRIEELYSLVV
jgi:hypothetical protein